MQHLFSAEAMAQLVDVETDILTNFRGAFCLWFQILIQFLLRAIRFLPPNPDPPSDKDLFGELSDLAKTRQNGVAGDVQLIQLLGFLSPRVLLDQGLPKTLQAQKRRDSSSSI